MAEKNEFSITRVFDAPRKLVFEAFTQADHLAHWWGPTGFVLGIKKLELRIGGTFHYSMTDKEGNTMWGKFVFREIRAPEQLVFVNSFSNENGDVIDTPFDHTFPREILNSWTFTEHHGKTTLTLRATPLHVNDEGLKSFEALFTSMQEGYGGTFDKLDEHLEKINHH